jgi:hypothetical protein
MHKSLATLTAAGLSLGLTAQASAVAFTYSEDFQSSPVGDSLPAGYVENSGDFDIVNESWTVSDRVVQIISDGTSGLENAAYTGQSNEGVDSSEWLDYNVSVRMGTDNWSDSTTSSLWGGMVVRLQDNGEAYGFRIWRGTIELFRVTDTGAISSLSTPPSSTGTIDSDEEIDVTFSVVNNAITDAVDLSVTMITDNGSGPGTGVTRTETASIDFTNPAVVDGPGSFAFITNSATRGWTWDDVTITGSAIPEPASLALVGLGGLAMLGRRRIR